MSGKVFYSSEYSILKDRTQLILSAKGRDESSVAYTIEKQVSVCKQPIHLAFSSVLIEEDFVIEKNSDIAYFDADKIVYPLTLRHWRKGDSFIPFGMKNRKKLSDYFSDRKLNRLEKENCWLLCSGNDIIWLVGERADNRFRINPSTKKALIIRFYREE